MDLLGGAGSLAGVAAFAVSAWQLRVAVMERRDRRRTPQPTGRPDSSTEGALPVVAPLGRLPVEVLGRDELVAEMVEALKRRRGRAVGVWVLTGLGGMGKSTIALRLASEASQSGYTVWWINAGDQVSLNGGLLEILRQTGAPDDILREVRDGRPTAPARFWQFMAGEAKTKALLVFDNVNQPSVLSVNGHSSPGDGDGWLRSDAPVLTLVTTRTTDPRAWGDWVELRRLEALPDEHAAALLRSLAPDVRDPDGSGALSLARRLGGLPLALHLAGTYLSSPFTRWATFEAYSTALNTTGIALTELDLEGGGQISHTWELSLDALTVRGIAQARPLLYLLACFDPLTPTPAIASILTLRNREEALRALAGMALVDVVSSSDLPAVTLHPVVADACRARLRAADPGGLVREAVRSLVTAATGLDSQQVGDWPAWERLYPHVAALAGWAAPQLDEPSLVALLDLGREVINALWTNASAALWGNNGHRVAGDDLIRALEIAGRELGEEHPALLMARYQSAILLLRVGSHIEAEAALNALLETARRVLGSRHRGTLSIREGLSGLYLAQDRFVEAEQAYCALISDQESAFGAGDPDVLTARIDLAWAIGMQGRYAEAAEICTAVVDADCRTLGPAHFRTLDARSDLARWLLGAGRIDEARAQAEDLLAVIPGVLGANHPMSLLTRAILAKVEAADGHDADTLFAEVLATMDEVLGPLDYRTILVRRDRAESLTVGGGQAGPPDAHSE